MPKIGFKSFTINENTYNALWKLYEHQKPDLVRKGITKFSSFLIYLINQKLAEEGKLTDYGKPLIEKVKVLSDMLIFKDNLINRIIEIKISKGKLFCEFDKKDDCVHVGFAYSLHETYNLLRK